MIIKLDLARTIEMNIHTKDAETFLTTFTDTVSDSLAACTSLCGRQAARHPAEVA